MALKGIVAVMRDELLANMTSLRASSAAMADNADAYATAARPLHDLHGSSWGDDELTSSLLHEYGQALTLATAAHDHLRSMIGGVGDGLGDMADTYADADHRSAPWT
jgi:hypothetical protein